MEDFSTDLLLLADYTNITSILVIICCSVGMTLFIYLFRWTGDLSHRTVDFRPQQRNMVKVSNPFVLELDPNTRELGDFRQMSVCSLSPLTLCSCHVLVIWGPKIQALHDLILTPGRTVRKKMLNNLEQSTDLHPLHVDVLQLSGEGKHTLSLPTPECVSSQALGEMPRSRYPLVVFVFTLERGGDGPSGVDNRDHDTNANLSHNDDMEQDNDIIGLFAIMHLKDDTVTKDSHMIAKYVKTAGIPIYSLQTLFVSSMDQPHQASSTIHSDQFQTQQSVNQSFSTTSLRHRHIPNSSSSASCLDNEFTEPVQFTSGALNESRRNESSSSVQSLESQENGDNSCQINQERVSSGSDLPLINHDDGESSTQGETNISNCHTERNNNRDVLMDDLPNNEPDSIHDCVVCQTNPANCALLPCRHNCVCLRCLRLLYKCPLCRASLESYFIVTRGQDGESSLEDEDEDEEAEEEENERIIRQGVAARVENMFERVNQMVGFA